MQFDPDDPQFLKQLSQHNRTRRLSNVLPLAARRHHVRQSGNGSASPLHICGTAENQCDVETNGLEAVE